MTRSAFWKTEINKQMYIRTYMLTENMGLCSWVSSCENGEILFWGSSPENKWMRAMSEASRWIVPVNLALRTAVDEPLYDCHYWWVNWDSLGNIVFSINSWRFVMVETSERRYECIRRGTLVTCLSEKSFEWDKKIAAQSQATIDLHEFSIGTELRLSWSKSSSISDWYAAWTEKLKYKK